MLIFFAQYEVIFITSKLNEFSLTLNPICACLIELNIMRSILMFLVYVPADSAHVEEVRGDGDL